MQWGVNNGGEAIVPFSLTQERVKETGNWFHYSGILGAFTDGIIDDKTILETKCPYTERNLTIEEAVTSSATFCLGRSDNGVYVLNKGCVYWHQLQGEMYFSQRKF